MRTHPAAALAVPALAIFLVGCSRAPIAGPPEIRLGRDECADCGMLVSEDRCSSALLIDVSGSREYAIFDDIGCMLDYLHDPPESTRVVGAFVHDHGDRRWIDAGSSFILFADPARLKTPMGFGIVAVASRQDAESLRQTFGGDIVDWNAAPARRLAMTRGRAGAAAADTQEATPGGEP
ncbi:MAG: nitrous oxide reductase accessory protein NosL [Phycisphaerales bacterium]